MFYSKSTGGFYDTAIHGGNIPDDAVEITTAQHHALIEGQSQGKQITADKKGKPVLTDPPAPTAEQLQTQANSAALAYLSQTDWYVVRKTETGVAIPADILAKRQEARDSIK